MPSLPQLTSVEHRTIRPKSHVQKSRAYSYGVVVNPAGDAAVVGNRRKEKRRAPDPTHSSIVFVRGSFV